MKNNPIKFILFIIVSSLLAGCSATKYLKENETYYSGAEINYIPKSNLEDNAEIDSKLKNLLRPEPNDKLLGARPGVWFYNVAGEVDKEKGFKYWLKYKLGRKPVLMEDVDVEVTRKRIEASLHNKGYFDARVNQSIRERKHTTGVIYDANISTPYHYDSIFYNLEDSILQENIKDVSEQRLIKKGDRYDLDMLVGERARLEKELKDFGFYHFADDYILFRADTTVGNKRANIYMTLKESAPLKATQVYEIEKVNVFTDYTFDLNKSVAYDTLQVDSVAFVQERDKYKPDKIVEHVSIRPGDIYSKEDELVTLNRLIQLDVFKYVNVDYQEIGYGNQLEANVYMTPYKKKSVRLELQAVSKSNNYVGPNFQATFKNRNAMRGAEIYELNFDAGYEIQVGSSKYVNENASYSSLNSYTLGVENVLTIPRIISPFNIRNRSSRFVPQTKLKLGARTLKRLNFFTLNSIDAAYGFNWRETKTRRHELYPIDINFIQLGKISDEFNDILDENPILKQSYEEQFILGTSYSFYYNSQNDTERTSRINVYFNGNIDLAGNMMYLGQSLITPKSSTDTTSYEIVGSPYSQFVKTDLDIRHYFQLGKKSKLVTRAIAGVGYAFGNTSVLPFIKQFSVGGSTSIRAFRARSVGPGTYQIPDDSDTFVDQAADIKLEANIEYRFPIYGAFKGALFVDAGNIWTIRNDDQRPGSKFKSGSFLSELAMGTGLGIRFDADFFVLRLDLAFPLRVPYRDKGDRWVYDSIDIGSGEWRGDNLILNIAIGYPF